MKLLVSSTELSSIFEESPRCSGLNRARPDGFIRPAQEQQLAVRGREPLINSHSMLPGQGARAQAVCQVQALDQDKTLFVAIVEVGVQPLEQSNDVLQQPEVVGKGQSAGVFGGRQRTVGVSLRQVYEGADLPRRCRVDVPAD